MNDSIIEQYYLDNNYPSADKLYKLLKKDNIVISLSKIKEWLSKQEVEQITKQVKQKSTGHITAFFENEFWNIDIFDLSKYDKYNKGYKYIFCAIDIFTRRAWCKALKNKDNTSVLGAFENIIKDNKPKVIISDSDSVFLSKSFTDFLKKHNIIQNTVPVGDHHSLGIIDRFALTLKRILTKHREITKKPDWVDVLDKVISIYNKTEHRALGGLTPNEAAQDKNKETIQKLNIDKSQDNKTETDLLPGDKVRILDKRLFKKGSDPQYTSEVYTVESAHGKTVYLEGGIKKKRNMLLKVHKDTVSSKSITQQVTKEKNIERRLNNEGVEESNIIQGKRR